MSFSYQGINPETGAKLEKNFETDEFEAIDFANDNYIEYPKFKVINNDTEEVVYSDQMEQDEIEATVVSMFPDEDSRAGFDTDEFGLND